MHREVWILLSTLLAWPLPAVAQAAEVDEADAAEGAPASSGEPDTSVSVCLSELDPEPEPGPCLNMVLDPGEPEPGPCLDMMAEQEEPEQPVGPCLDVPQPDTSGEACLTIEPRSGRCDVSDGGGGSGLPAVLGGALLLSAAGRRRRAEAVLERLERAGKLPPDVLERLRRRK